MPRKTPGLYATLNATLAKIDKQIHVLQNEAQRISEESGKDVTEYEMQTPDMHHQMIFLLLARSNVLLAIAIDNG